MGRTSITSVHREHQIHNQNGAQFPKVILNLTTSTRRLARQRLRLPEYEFDVLHLAGIKYQPAVTLYRLQTVGENRTPLDDCLPIFAIDLTEGEEVIHIIDANCEVFIFQSAQSRKTNSTPPKHQAKKRRPSSKQTTTTVEKQQRKSATSILNLRLQRQALSYKTLLRTKDNKQSCCHIYSNVSCISSITHQSPDTRDDTECMVRRKASITGRMWPMTYIKLSHNAQVVLETVTSTAISNHYNCSLLPVHSSSSQSTVSVPCRRRHRLNRTPFSKEWYSMLTCALPTTKTKATDIANLFLNHWITSL